VNRAILIVICDFLVSAMLSMMTGMVPAHTGGTGVGLDHQTTALLIAELRQRRQELTSAREQLRQARQKQGFDEERERQLRELTAQLADTLAKTEKLENQMKLKPESAGALTPEQLQARLDKEVQRRYQLRLEYDEARERVAELQHSLASTSGDLNKLNENYAAARQRLSDTRDRLDEAKETLKEREAKLDAASREIMKAREELAAREAALSGTRGQLSETKTALKEALTRTGEISQAKQQLEGDLSYTRGRLTAAERELAEARSQAERIRKLAAEREMERNEAKRQLAEMSAMLKNAVTELSQTKNELGKTREVAANTGKELIVTQGKVERTNLELEQAQRQLSEAEKKLSTDVLARYSSAAIRLDIDVTEKRLFLNQHGGGRFFLPLVKLDGRSVMVNTFPVFAGNAYEPLNFTEIIRADYKVDSPDAPDSSAGIRLAGPILTLPDEPRVAAMEFNLAGRAPLEVMTIEKLKKRGLEELFLFKTSSFGKQSAGLAGRCSLDFTSGDRYLYIRNTGRGTGSELRAEPGDLVLTKEGDFVGVVVSIEKFDFGRREEAKCYVFSDAFSWKDAPAVPIGKQPGENGFERFGSEILRHYDVIGKFTGN
jgi:cingulin-like protein 1